VLGADRVGQLVFDLGENPFFRCFVSREPLDEEVEGVRCLLHSAALEQPGDVAKHGSELFVGPKAGLQRRFLRRTQGPDGGVVEAVLLLEVGLEGLAQEREGLASRPARIADPKGLPDVTQQRVQAPMLLQDVDTGGIAVVIHTGMVPPEARARV
jgi:hypothetical protein